MDRPRLPPGTACPCCRGCTFDIEPDGTGQACLNCSACGCFCRLVQRTDDPAPVFSPFPPDGSRCAHREPMPGGWWLALVQSRDYHGRPVALSPTAAAAMQTALAGSLDGNLLLLGTDPPQPMKKETES
jgi:hypothetical protein